MKTNYPLYKSCKHSGTVVKEKIKGEYKETSFITNWCGELNKICKASLQYCHKYENENKTTGKLSGEK